jgi:hypothetical protein
MNALRRIANSDNQVFVSCSQSQDANEAAKGTTLERHADTELSGEGNADSRAGPKEISEGTAGHA